MKKLLLGILILVLSLTVLSGCNSSEAVSFSITEEQIQSICELTTMECFFKNVAKSTKTRSNFLQSEREVWCEYTGVVRVGIDFNEVTLQEDGNELIITLPKARVLSIDVNEIQPDNIIKSEGGLFAQQITAEDVTQAMQEAQEMMKESAATNNTILLSARNKAKIIIANYIDQMDELAGTSHTIRWKYENNVSDDTPASESSPEDLRIIP